MANIIASVRLSDEDRWATAQPVFDALDAEFHFTLDVCADESNHKCARYYGHGGLQEDGLAGSWANEVCFMNPPYGKPIGLWCRKAADSAEREGALVVGLLPNRTDTQWWQDVMRASEVRFVKGRLKFGGKDGAAPFGSVIAVWGGGQGAGNDGMAAPCGDLRQGQGAPRQPRADQAAGVGGCRLTDQQMFCDWLDDTRAASEVLDMVDRLGLPEAVRALWAEYAKALDESQATGPLNNPRADAQDGGA